MKRRRLVARVVPLVLAILAASAAVALAGDPITWGRPYGPNAQLTWKFAGAYADWLTGATRTALETNWDDATTNNSQSAQFPFDAKGLGTIVYSSSINSPCHPSTPNPVWLASACSAGQTNWHIYIHNFDPIGYKDWVWIDKPGACASGRTCFQLRRTLIHEPIHLTGGGSAHSTQPPDLTVFLKGQASNAKAIGRYYMLRACDEAGAQKAYDLRDLSGPYSSCLGSLSTQISLNGTFQACQGLPILVGGRLAVAGTAYSRLNGNPLAGRVVNLDLDGKRVASLRALATSSGNNWALWLAGVGAGVRTYTASFDGEGPLKAAPPVSITVVWVPRAEC